MAGRRRILVSEPGSPFCPTAVHFPAGLRFRLGKTTYILSRSDARALQRLAALRKALPTDTSTTWLLRHRNWIRSIVATRPRTALTLAALATDDRRLIELALWLRGRCQGTVGANDLCQLALRNDLQLQRHVARCLQSMGAWAQLRILASQTDLARYYPRVVWQPPPRAFDTRMASYLAKVRPRTISASRRALWMPNDTIVSRRRPGKPLWLIRLVLDRVRLLVSDQTSVDRLPKS